MSQHYNLYESLGLNPQDSTPHLREQIQNTLTELRKQGLAPNSGPVQENLAALSILGNGYRRGEYDRRLADADAPPITIASLRSLAAHPAPDLSPQPSAGTEVSRDQSATDSDSAQPTDTALDWNVPDSAAHPPFPPAKPKVVVRDVSPLPEGAAHKDLWKRLPKIPRVVAALLSTSFVLSFLTMLWATFEGFYYLSEIEGAKNADSSGLLGAIAGLGTVFGAILPLVVTPVVLVTGLVVALLSLYWVREILLGRSATAGIFLPTSTATTGIAATAAFILFVGTYSGALLGVAGVLLFVVTGLSLTGEVKAWFRGKILVKTTAPTGRTT